MLEIERRWICGKVIIPPGLIRKKEYIEQAYVDYNGECRIRMSYDYTHSGNGLEPNTTYTLTRKTFISEGICEEDEHKISYDEFRSLDDEDAPHVSKHRTTFEYNSYLFEFDQFKLAGKAKLDGLIIMELELSDINESFNMPSFISVIKEVTDDRRYSNRSMSKLDDNYNSGQTEDERLKLIIKFIEGQ